MNTLKTIRKKHNLTQIDAAKICGVSRRTYQTYEEGGPTTDSYDELLKVLQEMCIDRDLPPLLNINIIKSITSKIFAKYEQIKCAYLFGSYARNEATLDSDVDILVVAPGLDGFAYAGLHAKLRKELGKEIDLINHTTLLKSERMLRDILVQGVKIYGCRTSQIKN